MNNFIDDKECDGCEYWDSLYGCMEHDCPTYKDWEECKAEMTADNEHDKRKDERTVDPIFNGILDTIRGIR